MWTVIKFDKKKINLLQQDLLKYIGKDCVFYRPKIQIQKYYKNKLIKLEKIYFSCILMKCQKSWPSF